ncbi:acetylornithine deacetylase [Pseudomaricurvus alkylphenolicus]|uniref:acetylornithine deacetylase n=1 Tax=Pseudomaricurvus alkylphenolicus TaxID=1306991 RepID=UPI0014200307|nr:acetylornithine deacetylase [Pseudomaricurvus alkylphenolicus]NIB41086.1 acetylornithine deacetylase [Pseudomaricurvus alkylphenolicus]
MSRADSISLLQQLVAFDTTSHLSNLALIDFIVDYLKGFGVESQRVFSENKSKANLYATIGPKDIPGVMLSGHTDVVPVKGQSWDTNPFTVVEKDGALFGRGTADMKGFIAVVLSRVPQMVEADLKTPIHLAFSYDEEIGCVGVRRLLHMMEGLPVKPAMCIIGEPTEMSVGVAHKGKIAARVKVRGVESHSSLPQNGVNAIEYAAELIAYIRRYARQLAQKGPFDSSFETPYSTLQTGVIQGGSAVNIVPNSCEFDFEIRNIPLQNIEELFHKVEAFARDELQPTMRSEHKQSGITIERLSSYPGLLTPANAEIVRFVKKLANQDKVGTIAFGTEGGLFSETLGIPTVVCGPGSIVQAHKPNEYIRVPQLRRAEQMIDRLISSLSIDENA